MRRLKFLHNEPGYQIRRSCDYKLTLCQVALQRRRDLEEDDIIIEINRKVIHDVSEYKNAVMAAQKENRPLLLVRHGEKTMFFTVRP